MIDPATITEPTRDPESGAWVYPTTWAPDARAAFEETAEQLASEERLVAKLEAAAKASAASPEIFLAAQRRKLAETKRAREAAETEAADDAAWATLTERHGSRIGRVYTESGSLILRALSEAESNAIQARVDGVVRAALEADPPDERRAAADSIKAYQEGILTMSLVHPAPVPVGNSVGASPKARAIVAAYPGVWGELYALRDELNRGRRVALGKGAAR